MPKQRKNMFWKVIALIDGKKHVITVEAYTQTLAKLYVKRQFPDSKILDIF